MATQPENIMPATPELPSAATPHPETADTELAANREAFHHKIRAALNQPQA